MTKFLFNTVFPSRKNNFTFETNDENETLYQKRYYKKWTPEELGYIKYYIRNSARKNFSINLTKLRNIMPERSYSSIRCKVRECCIELNIDYSTYTERYKTPA